MKDEDYLRAVQATIPVSEREITQLGDALDQIEIDQDQEALEMLNSIGSEAGGRLKSNDYFGQKCRLSDMLLLFGINHLRVRMTNKIIDGLRQKLKKEGDLG